MPHQQQPDLDAALRLLRDWCLERCPPLTPTWCKVRLEGAGKVQWVKLPIPPAVLDRKQEAPS